MTDINEVKNAETVVEQDVAKTVTDVAALSKLMEELAQNPAVSDVKVTEGTDTQATPAQ